MLTINVDIYILIIIIVSKYLLWRKNHEKIKHFDRTYAHDYR